MNAYRCPECGDVRWSFIAGIDRDENPPCEICGTTMVAERRRPGAFGGGGAERREGTQSTADARTAG